VYQLLVRR